MMAVPMGRRKMTARIMATVAMVSAMATARCLMKDREQWT